MGLADDEPNQEGVEQGPCPHCGYVHRKKSGRLKTYVGALKCPVFVMMFVEDMLGWGTTTRNYPRFERASKSTSTAVCNAGDHHICFYKGTVNPSTGKRLCRSPDGFDSEIPETEKIMFVVQTHGWHEARDMGLPPEMDQHDERWIRNDDLLCKDRGRGRKPPDPPVQDRKRGAKKTKGYVVPPGNFMPDAGLEQVRKVLFARIEFLRQEGHPVTAYHIAALGGKTEKRQRTAEEEADHRAKRSAEKARDKG